MRMRYKTYQNDPRELRSKYDSKCAETGKDIKKGDLCVYYPNVKKIYHPDSRTAYEFRVNREDWRMGHEY